MRKTKITSLILAVLMLVSVFALTGCEQKAEAKLGLGVTVATTVTEATPEADGETASQVVFAAVTVDANGKITGCDIDQLPIEVAFTLDGTAGVPGEFVSKRELGDNYGMAAAMNTTEWYAQVDGLESVIVGKTLDEVNALVVDGYGTEEVANASCTIGINDFIVAVGKAYNNAKTLGSSASDKVVVSYSATASVEDATEEANGKIQADVSFAAVTTNDSGKITGCMTDAVSVKTEFDTAGVPVEPAAAQTKRELGDNYGMAAAMNTNEWYTQADALDKSVVGKTADEVLGVMDESGVPNEEVANAGCTINIYAAVTAINKAAK